MIYTVTFNPSLDYLIQLDKLTAGTINRTTQEKICCGGKGINVSIVLKNLGFNNTALGFIAGFTGTAIEEMLTAYGCQNNFIRLKDGFSRINVKVKAAEESEINGQGPQITEAALDKLFSELDKLQAGDFLVLAGSIPKTMPTDIYEKIMQQLNNRQISIIVDATCSLLLNVLKYHPFIIKPNHHELGEMFGVTLTKTDEIISYARRLQDFGAQNVLISMAGDGAILLTADGQIYQSGTPKGTLVNSVGAGDSMVAGFIAGYLETNDFNKAFKFSIATGSASAFSSELATRPEVEALLTQLD